MRIPHTLCATAAISLLIGTCFGQAQGTWPEVTKESGFQAKVIHATMPDSPAIRRGQGVFPEDVLPKGKKWLYLSIEVTVPVIDFQLPVASLKVLAENSELCPAMAIGDATLFDLFTNAEESRRAIGQVGSDSGLELAAFIKEGESILEIKRKTVSIGLLYAVPSTAKVLSWQVGAGASTPITVGRDAAKHTQRASTNAIITFR